MSGLILSGFKRRITGLLLIPHTGGCFEITVDGELIHSKLETDEFPDEAWVIDAITERLKKK